MAAILNNVEPEVGDLIEIFRGSYQHWAVYVGDGFIVDFAPPSQVPGSDANSPSVLAEMAKVKKAKLSDVAGNDKWKINNILDDKYEALLSHVIEREACAKVGEEMLYNVILWNCEHFATEMRYGKAVSCQVRKIGDILRNILDPLVISVGEDENC